jgi:hypothetical protein
MKKIKVIIKRDGQVQLEVNGAMGPVCREFSKLFENAVGDVVRCELKPEHDLAAEQVREQNYELGS